MKKKILLVEDEENERILYREELEKEGYEVITACNGREGCETADREKIDLVVLDLHMPEMDGLEALGRILMKKRNLPILIYTAFPRYQDNFMSWAADAYVVKSADLAPLKERVRALIER